MGPRNFESRHFSRTRIRTMVLRQTVPIPLTRKATVTSGASWTRFKKCEMCLSVSRTPAAADIQRSKKDVQLSSNEGLTLEST